MVDARGVDDPGGRPEAVAVEARRRLVQGGVVERCGQRALLEVAAHDRHRVDRRHRRYTEAAKRSDQPAARGVGEREVVDGGREDVGDLLRDQLLGRGHPDVERLVEAADRVRRLLAERGVRLVADHQLIGGARDLVGVTREPGVGLDRERVGAQRLVPAYDRVGEPVAVALGRQVTAELVDEQPAVREDQHSEPACAFDEAGGGDRLARCGGMAEAVAACGARVLAGELGLLELLVDEPEVLVLLVLRLLDELDDGAVRRPVAVLVRASLRRRDQLREHPGERVDLVAPKRRPGSGLRCLGGEHPLEPEHQPVAHLPSRRRARAGRRPSRPWRRRARGAGRSPARARRRPPHPGGGTARRTSARRGLRRPPSRRARTRRWR